MENIVDTDAEHARLVEAIPRHIRKDGTVNYTSLGIEFDRHRSNIKRKVAALGVAGALGFVPVIPGFGVKAVSTQYRGGAKVAESIKQTPLGEQTETVPKGFAIKGVSTLRDSHGNTIVEWTKTREEPSAVDYAEMLKTAFADYQPAAVPVALPTDPYTDSATLYALSDQHWGMFAWKGDAPENWDLKIAEMVIGGATERLFASTAPSALGIVLGGGDATHADNNSNMTAKSGNVLQVDGRYDKVIGAVCRYYVKTVDLALAKHQRVIVRVLKGNHDEHAATAIGYFLLAWYRNEPRVTVDVDASPYWWFRFGKTLLGATHGHAAKPERMPMIMAHRRAEDWGETKHRFVHMFHVHHASKFVTENEGVIVETHQVPIPQDAWHFAEGFLSGRSMQSIVYDREYGEIGRSRVAITN